MHALFFEVRPKQGHLKHYFEHVAVLKPVLAQHAGLIFIDRYSSLVDRDVVIVDEKEGVSARDSFRFGSRS